MNLFTDQFGLSIEQQINDYMETKSMSNEFLDYIEKFGDCNKVKLFRGDCLYESVIKIGNAFRLWNGFASFTSNKEIAKKFSNDRCVPDWYYDEHEWCANAEYPFKEFINNKENLVPVIIVVDNGKIPKCFSTEKYSDRLKEDEYVVLTEEIEFIIERIEGKYIYCDIRRIPNMHLWR